MRFLCPRILTLTVIYVLFLTSFVLSEDSETESESGKAETAAPVTYKIEVVVPGSDIILGEGPHWDAEQKALFYVDIVGQKIGRYMPSTKENVLFSVSDKGTPSFIIPVEKSPGDFILGLNLSLVHASISWDKSGPKITGLKVLHTVDKEYGFRFNEAKCDALGRMWAGTSGYPTGRRRRRRSGRAEEGHHNARLYTLELNGTLSLKVDKLGISNGLEWSLDDSKFYLADSSTSLIYEFDHDLASGKIQNRRELRKLQPEFPASLPDGMTMDSQGNLWVAHKSTGLVLNIDAKTGNTIRTVDFKGHALEVLSGVFGGENLDELYVTSSKLNLSPERLREEPNAGAIFRVTNLGGVKGARAGRLYKPTNLGTTEVTTKAPGNGAISGFVKPTIPIIVTMSYALNTRL